MKDKKKKRSERKKDESERQREQPRGLTSIYTRLVLIFVSIVLITVLTLGMTLAQIFVRQYESEMSETLWRQCDRVNELVPVLTYGEEKQREDANIELRFISRESDAIIWYFELGGVVKQSIVDPLNNFWQTYNVEANMNSEYMSEVLSGKVISGYNLFNDEIDAPVMSVGRPLVEEGEIVGAIFIHARTADMDARIADLMQKILIASCLAVAVSIVLISVIAYRFSQPLVTMNRVVQTYATGDFSRRVPEKGRDEVGQLAVSINEMAADLQSLEDMRRSFVANVSHELKSPLTSMRGFLQAIIDHAVPEEDVEHTLDIVLDETKRMNVLINDLLDLSKIESGTFPLNYVCFDVQEMMLRSLLTFEARIEKQEMQVEIDFEQEKCLVWADKERIDQVVRNLIDNSIKYGGAGCTLTLSCRKENGLARIELRDNGAGIKAEDLPFVWERFYKADKAHTSGSEGTGLGLSIVKRILDQHNAHPYVWSEEGVGTTFRFDLALAKKGQTRTEENAKQ